MPLLLHVSLRSCACSLTVRCRMYCRTSTSAASCYVGESQVTIPAVMRFFPVLRVFTPVPAVGL
jgi:hypothetical protein